MRAFATALAVIASANGTTAASPRATFEVSAGPTHLYDQLGAEASLLGGARLSHSVTFAWAAEASVGAPVYRDESDALVMSLTARSYIASGVEAWQASVAIGYQIN
jgi:hypothetical protein